MIDNLIMSYVLKKNGNDQSPVYNRWFAFVNSPGTLSTTGLAQHMVEHGVISERGKCEAFIAKLSICIPELLASGYSVRLDGLGVFGTTMANRKGGAATPADFDINTHCAGVRIRFKPDSTDLNDITSKKFGKMVSFGDGFFMKGGDDTALYPLAARNE